MANEISTMYSFLMHGVPNQETPPGITYNKLVDVYEDPDLGGEPERIQVTTLTDSQHRYIRGVEDVDSFTYSAYYTHADYEALKNLEGKIEPYAEWYGVDGSGDPDGHNGRFSFTGELSVYLAGGGVNDPRSMTITITVNSKVVDETPDD